VGVAPFDVSGSGTTIGSLSVVLIFDVVLGAIAIYKGKPMLGVVGIFVPLVSLTAAVRLASPSSRWARGRYEPGGRKLERAQERWVQIEERRTRVADLIAGAPAAEDAAGSGRDPIHRA
jgi:hypothetical protein